MHTAERGKVCGVMGAVLGAVTTEPTRIPAGVGCCTTTLPTGCPATDAASWTDDDVVPSCGSTGTGAADEGSTIGRTDIGGGGRTPSMCILFRLNECRSNGRLFYNMCQNNKFTAVPNIQALCTPVKILCSFDKHKPVYEQTVCMHCDPLPTINIHAPAVASSVRSL